MKKVAIYSTADFTVWSIGNGWAYEFINKAAKRCVFVQGDDATQFRADLDSPWRTLRDVWCDYDSVSAPIAPRIKIVCPFPERPIYDAIVDGERIGSWSSRTNAEAAAEDWVRRHP